jgi:hypothetical protein
LKSKFQFTYPQLPLEYNFQERKKMSNKEGNGGFFTIILFNFLGCPASPEAGQKFLEEWAKATFLLMELVLQKLRIPTPM